MKWKVWLIGAGVSVLLSLFVAMAGVASGITWWQFVSVLGAALGTHFGAYLMKHPVEQIQFDTESFTKSSTTTNPKTGEVTTEASMETKSTPIEPKKD